MGIQQKFMFIAFLHEKKIARQKWQMYTVDGTPPIPGINEHDFTTVVSVDSLILRGMAVVIDGYGQGTFLSFPYVICFYFHDSKYSRKIENYKKKKKFSIAGLVITNVE